MSEFTPGPWQYEHRRGLGGMWNTEVFCSNGEVIATVAWYPKPEVRGVTSTYREDNARLIAAAPELLEALRICAGVLGVVSPGGDGDPDVIRARAAIAKATGEQP